MNAAVSSTTGHPQGAARSVRQFDYIAEMMQLALDDTPVLKIKGRVTQVIGTIIKAVVPTGKKAGCHQGRVAVRATGSFNIQTREGVVQGISHRHCTRVQRGDGYGYQQQQSNTDARGGRAAHDALCLPTAEAGGLQL